MTASAGLSSDSRHGPGSTFPRRCRLKNPRTIRDIYRAPSGRRSVSPFRCVWRQREDGSPARFAIVVSKRAAARATRRNRIRRRIREAIRANKLRWPTATDIILTANGDEAAVCEFNTLCRQVESILRRITDDAPKQARRNG